MPERDTNQLAHSVAKRMIELAEGKPEKNPAAVALGRRGGLKGGKARMGKMTADERRELAAKAARARWNKPSAG